MGNDISPDRTVIPYEERQLTKAEETRELVSLSAESIKERQRQLALLRGMVRDTLKRGIDYGRIPGTPSDCLWDPGAATIISAFNCAPGHRRILSLRDDGKVISIIVEVPLISNKTGNEVGSGIGATSTLETKYRYRWVKDPENWGYNDDAIKTLKTKTDDDQTIYRVENPEHGELLNTVIKMASKRAEVDAAETLPGVSTALREMFTGKGESKKDSEREIWTRYWGEIRRMGLTEYDVYKFHKVDSMKQWLQQGHTPDESLDLLRQSVSTPPDSPKPPGEATPLAPTASKIKPRAEWDAVKKEDLPNYSSLEKLTFQLAGIQPKEMYKELGGSSKSDLSIPPWDAFLTLKDRFCPKVINSQILP